MKALRHIHGITLIELMITLSTVALTLGLGVPAFTNLQANMHRGEAAAELATSITLARSEAARHGVPVTVCASSDEQTCATGTPPNWNTGWIVFTDQDEDRTVDGGAAPDLIIHSAHFEYTGFTLTTQSAIAYGATLQGSGNPSEVGTFRYCDGKVYQDLTLNYIGRVEITGTGTGCP